MTSNRGTSIEITPSPANGRFLGFQQPVIRLLRQQFHIGPDARLNLLAQLPQTAGIALFRSHPHILRQTLDRKSHLIVGDRRPVPDEEHRPGADVLLFYVIQQFRL